MAKTHGLARGSTRILPACICRTTSSQVDQRARDGGGGADPWLSAKARVLGNTIVTHERFDMANRRKFLIPNVCHHYGVECINTFDLLNRLEARLVLQD